MQPRIDKIRDYIRLDKIPKAFAETEQLLKEVFPQYLPRLILLSRSFNKNEKAFASATGIISFDEHRLQSSRIVTEFLNVISDIENSTQLPKSELDKISCNRKEILKFFWRRFDSKEKQSFPTHFYITIAQKYGQVESLIKRLVISLKEAHPNQVKFSSFEDIRIEPVDLSISDKYEDFQYEFCKAFNRILRGKEVKILRELADKIDTDYPNLKGGRYIPIILNLLVPYSFWSTCGVKSINWIVNDFCNLENYSPNRTFIFFFIVEINEQASASSKKNSLFSIFSRKNTDKPKFNLHQDLNAFSGHTKVTILPPLSLVSQGDLHDWFRKIEPNEKIRDQRVNTLIGQLPKSDKWHMSDVEIELAKIIAQYQNAFYKI